MMRAVVQRVTSARVRVGGRVAGEVGRGLLLFVGMEHEDGPADVSYLAGKVLELRVFEGREPGETEGRPGPVVRRKMDRSVGEVGGGILVVPQFTLNADCRKGRRPSFDRAAPPGVARALYEDVVRELRATGVHVETGEFQAFMSVELVNDGPVTFLLDSRRQF